MTLGTEISPSTMQSARSTKSSEPSKLADRVDRRLWSRRLIGLAIFSVCILVIHLLLQRQPEFYTERLEVAEQSRQKDLSKNCLKRGLQLLNDIQNGRNWNEEFSEEQINAWLAVDFRENHAQQSLPRSVAEPRVAIQDDHVQVGFRFATGPLSTIVHIGIRTWVPKPRVLAVQLDGAWVGAIPLPASYTRQLIEKIADAYKLDVTWKRHGSRLVALLEFPHGHRSTILKRVEIRTGRLRVQGISGRLALKANLAPKAN